MNHTILVVDDELHMRKLLKKILTEENYRVILASNGRDAINIVKSENPAFIILDLMMPGIDGYDTCNEIRQFSDVPLLMLTARASDEDKVKGLRTGADDYLLKPFGKKELLARIEAILRRTSQMNRGQVIQERQLTFGNLNIEPMYKEVFVDGEQIKLTKKEYELLVFFSEHPKIVFSREQLLDKIWGFDYENVTSRTVDTHIKTLRIKLKKAGKYIHTVWGMGYKFEVQK
ncbi:response regulator transcription factor [Evansella halocellulosilytica]|uniref:response regulator transcription factor n=1 Tax=Evansella halocellulosilytica TaxID=2011013 RepID=UPI000BB72D8A|nr:response regulator transcription factor [Evansella halocellulosilytica]